MKKKIFRIFSLMVMGLLIVLSSCKKDEEASKELVASGHPDWPPIMYKNGEQISGAGPEIVEKIFSELGVKVISRYEGTWDIVQNKAKSGEVDVLVAAYKTAERETYMNYSIPYTVDPVILIIKKGKPFVYDKWEDLVGQKGVLMIGDSYGQDFDQFIKDNLTPVKVETPQEAFALLDKEEVDYFIYALYSALTYISKNNISSVEIIPKYITAENFYLTISKKSSFVHLLPQVDVLLQKYKDDGTIQRIIEKNKLK